MKTPLIFEKDDILKLIYGFLKRKGFDVPGPDKVKYKGALQVRVEIEMDLDVKEVEEAFALRTAPAAPESADCPPEVPTAPAEDEAEPDIDQVLHASKTLANQPAPYGSPPPRPPDPPPRQLGPEESYEWPGDKPR